MDDPTNEHEQGDLLFNHKERVQTLSLSLSIEEQLIRLCTDAGFVQKSRSWTTLYDKGMMINS